MIAWTHCVRCRRRHLPPNSRSALCRSCAVAQSALIVGAAVLALGIIAYYYALRAL